MSQNAQKILALVLLGILLLAIPFTIWYGALQQQQVQQKAATHVWNGGIDTCGHVQVAFENESPTCLTSGTVTNTYQTTVRLTSKDGGTYNVNYLFESFWCKDSSELGDGVNPASCIKRVKSDSKTISVGPGGGQVVTSILQTASSYGFGGSCGVYQTDFSFKINGTSCFFGYSALDTNPQHPVLAAGYCNTNKVCTVPSPTPTPTLPVTPTPTLPATPTPTLPVTPTPTIPVTTTPTPTTPVTPGPSDTPVPTVPPTIAVSPTLPPTGPGDVILGVGFVGVAVALLGTIVILAL